MSHKRETESQHRGAIGESHWDFGWANCEDPWAVGDIGTWECFNGRPVSGFSTMSSLIVFYSSLTPILRCPPV